MSIRSVRLRSVVSSTFALASFAGGMLLPAGASSADSTVAAKAGALQVPDMPVEKYVLPNGLEVVLHVDRRTPTVAVNVWYHVGS
ncbi:MAG TPA: hypothetical protein VL400_26745, partial [Polyangiaceae bacterium]|nr:hypothetical protein [Polyangiaceae bacterium]